MIKFTKLELTEFKQWEDDDYRFSLVFNTIIKNYNDKDEDYELSLVISVSFDEDNWSAENQYEIWETRVWNNREFLKENYYEYYNMVSSKECSTWSDIGSLKNFKILVESDLEDSLKELGDSLLEDIKNYESSKSKEFKTVLEDLY